MKNTVDNFFLSGTMSASLYLEHYLVTRIWCIWFDFHQVPMPMVYNAEEIMGGDGEGMVAIGMVEEDENGDVQHHQVRPLNKIWVKFLFSSNY